MWKLDFFLLPSNSYHSIGANEAREFGEKADYLNNNEALYIPNEFYDIEDREGITAIDFLYGDEQCDVSDYFVEIISKQKSCGDSYEKIGQKDEHGYLPITKDDIRDEIGHLCVENIEDVEEERCLRANDIVEVKRFYLKRVKDYTVYQSRAETCFPNLIFHDEAFTYIEKLGKCSDVAEELSRHLTILNDVGKKLYDYHKKDENAVLSQLKSGYGIVCSGKGSEEKISYNKKFFYNDREYQLTCNPHTKLYEKRTDQRIYFCWGRNEIENHKIIIVRIGDHWQE